MKNAIKLTIGISEKGDVLALELSDNSACVESPTHLFYEPIKQYIDMYKANKGIKEEDSQNQQTTSKEVYVSYYSLSYLQSNKHGYDGGLGYCTSFGEYNPAVSGEIVVDRPIIHLTYGDIFLNSAEPYKRYARYMDSSIWNYYVPVLIIDEKAKPDEDGKTQRYDFTPLDIALKEIICNHLNNRYQLRVAREYAHLFSRIVNQSFLPDISGHGKNVSPYLFHSERKSSKDLKKEEHINILSKIKQYKWRILLVDDHCTEKMAIVDIEKATLTKLDIVKTELENLFYKGSVATKKEEITDKTFLYIDCATTIEEAKNKLKEKKYEIILLDYLLGKKGAGREYGYELLKGIWYKENEKKFEKARKEELEKLYKEFVFDYKKGPDYRFYFMFISAFTTAVSERLLTEGWHRSEDYWYIGEGACPVNTPYLFQYRLLHIMEKRMKKMGIFILSKTANDDFKASKIYEDVIAKIFPEDKDKNKGGNIRKYANDKFQDVLSLLYHYKNLLVDTQITTTIFDTKESVLATDFVMKNPNLGGLLEHLTQLVYLTAFGTVRQWPEMWEEYQFIKSIIGQPIGAIEEYIVNLKNNDL